MQRQLLLLFIAAFCGGALTAQGYLRTEGTQIVNEAGQPYRLQGMGLGGWMVQEGYMMKTAEFAGAQHQLRELITELIGEDDTQEFYDAWLANHVREADIQKMKEVGFNSVRLPMHYNLYTLPIEDEPVAGQQTFLTKGLELTDSLIAWCKARDMYVILDLHAAPGGQGNDQNISDRDEDKPNLWQSEANRNKTVALWKHLAEYYADEPTVGGYDLINETNYDLGNDNAALRALYGEIVEAIRTVDTKHLIFIEGNGFANDFRGLTPPFDDNMAYSPHKYWNYNDQASIQYVLNLREEQQVPIYFGETGENSNVWFRNAAKLFADNDLGWAWWPWKKIESVTGPVSVTLTPGYQKLLDYWSDEGPKPSAAEAKASLLELTEELKLENARFQPDVTDALFRQVTSNETLPFVEHTLPGTIYAVDYDLGRIGYAYQDEFFADYRVATGTFQAWNNGFTYRNDGVDIEPTADTELTNGYNVGWTSDNEFLQYTVTVAEDGLYEAKVRVATAGDGGRLHFQLNGVDLNAPITVPNTGGYQQWQTLTVPNLPMGKTDNKLRLVIDTGGFNIGGMQFARTGDLASVATTFVSGITVSDSAFTISFNKALQEGELNIGDFTLTVDGEPVSITGIKRVENQGRQIRFTAGRLFRSGESIKLSYSGSAIKAIDGTPLTIFTEQVIVNTSAAVYAVPGKLEAEDYFFQQGVQTETTTDAGGGLNIGFLDVGDYLDYNIEVASAGVYTVDFRVASQEGDGAVKLQLVDGDETVSDLVTVDFKITGGWQTWQDFSAEVKLPAGRRQLRVLITKPLFNLNYLDFSLLTSAKRVLTNEFRLTASPNPTSDRVVLSGELPEFGDLTLKVLDLTGKTLVSRTINPSTRLRESVDLRVFAPAVYFVQLFGDGKQVYAGRIVRR